MAYANDTTRQRGPAASGFRAVASDAWNLGTHALHAARDWFDDWRTHKMGRRNDDIGDAAGYREDERRFERRSDLGVRGRHSPDPGAGYGEGAYAPDRTDAGVRGSAYRGASGHAYGLPRGAADRLGPYQDSWELGTGRGGRGLDRHGPDEHDADASRSATHGRPGGYAAVAGGAYYRGESRRGRGPRDYRRSDERIREDVCERLMDDDYVDARDLDVHVLEGTVTLAGTVGERWEKHRAEDIADACSGVREVENRIRVSAAPGFHGAGAEAAPSAMGDRRPPGMAASAGNDGGTAGSRAERGEIGNSG